MNKRSVVLCALLLLLAGCRKPEAVVTGGFSKKEDFSAAKISKPAAGKQRREYSGTADAARAATEQNAAGTAQAIEAEVTRGGPNGEVRIFEDAQEQARLVRGRAQKYMNAQFRYYLADVSLIQPRESGCARPVLALQLAVENLHGEAAAAIRGRFTFAQTIVQDGTPRPVAAPVGISAPADIVGPFSDKRGGFTYVTAFVEQPDSADAALRWQKIAEIGAARRKVWFAPEVFYYPDGDQYSPTSGLGPRGRDFAKCAA